VHGTADGERAEAAADTEAERLDAELSSIVDAWPRLPAAVRSAVAALVKAATGPEV